MRHGKWIVVGAALLASVVLTVVVHGEDANTLKIALICSGSTSDGGWNQSAKEAMDQVKKDLGAEVSVIEKVNEDKAADEMRDYASQGYNLVIGHGYEFLNPAAEVSRKQHKTKFAVSGADEAKGDIEALDFDLSQSCYQLGIIAARKSTTGKLGFIGGSKIPAVVACYRGFVAGAKSVKPDITVAEAYTSWDEPAKSKSQAEAFLNDGIDVIFQDVDAASKGVFEAIREHNDDALQRATPSKVYTFGSNSDQNANTVCPNYTLASAVIKLDTAFENVAKSVADGSFKPGVVTENLTNGVCITVLNPKLLGNVIDDQTQKLVDDAGKKLAAGQITIPRE